MKWVIIIAGVLVVGFIVILATIVITENDDKP